MATPEARPRVLVVDDKLPMAETLADGLVDEGFDAVAVGSSGSAEAMLRQQHVDLLVTDMRMPGLDGLELLAASKQADPQRPVIVMTAFGAIDSAVESIRRGAYHYLTKPFKLEELVIFIRRALEERQLKQDAAELRRALKHHFSKTALIGRSAPMQRVLDVLERVAPSDAPVLLTGETGTGKGAVARAIHGESPRAGKAFVSVNCAALPEALLESELFGYVKGAFTGATSDKPGLFAEANGGTLLLDEIGEMAPALQAKLLHVLETGTVRPVGATKERPVDTRIIAATHRDLRARSQAGQFREDLLYRLDVVSVELPALRHRREDIPLFVQHFLAQYQDRHKASGVRAFSRPALGKLLDYRWPGNIRELAHVVERCVLLAAGPEILEADLPASMTGPPRSGPFAFTGDIVPIRELQRLYAKWVLDELSGNKTRAAEKLGLDVKTLARWLAEDDASDASSPDLTN